MNLIAKSQEGPDREEEPVNGRDNLRLKSHSKDNDHDEEEKGDVKNEHSGSKGVEKQNEPEEQVAMSKAKKDEECKQSYEKDKSEEALRKNEEVKGVEPRIDDATEAGKKRLKLGNLALNMMMSTKMIQLNMIKCRISMGNRGLNLSVI